MIPLGEQHAADRLDQLVGQHGDEQVLLGAVLGVVEHRSQAEVGLQTAEHGLQVGQHRIGTPQSGVVPGGFVAAQAVDTRVGQLVLPAAGTRA